MKALLRDIQLWLASRINHHVYMLGFSHGHEFGHFDGWMQRTFDEGAGIPERAEIITGENFLNDEEGLF